MINTKIIYLYSLILFLLEFFGLKILYFTLTDFFCLSTILMLVLLLPISRISYTKTVIWYAIFVLMSCLYSWIYNGQGLYSVTIHSYHYFALLFFLALIQFDFSSEDILTVIKMLAFTCSIGYILQWLIYPTVIFSSVEFFATDDTYRARMIGSILFYFLLFYSVNRYILTQEWKYILYATLGGIPIIIQGFRTLTVLSVAALFLMIPFVLRSGWKTIIYSILGIGLALAVMNTSLVQSKMDEMQARQDNEQTLSNQDYIRYLSFDYYWNQQFTKPYEKVFGGGFPSDQSSKYYKQIAAIKESMGFYWSDLGLIGISLIIGIPAVLLLIWLYLQCIWKCKEPEIQYLRFTLFVVLTGSLFLTAEFLEYKYHQEQEALNCEEEEEELLITSDEVQ